MLTRLSEALDKFAAERPVMLAFLVFLGAAAIVIPASFPFIAAHGWAFAENVMGEAYGTLFDLLIIGWFLLWLRKRAESRMQNNRYREEIDDFLGWNSPEAAHRIAGNLRRLNRNGVEEGIQLTEAYLKGANLNGATLREADLWGANLSHAYLNGADLSGASLGGANCEEVDLENALLHEADLRGANLERADLERADLRGANLGGSALAKADLQFARLGGADLQHADLTSANLHGADLEGATLHRCQLKDANLQDADMRETDLREADLAGANMERANLLGARLPDGEELVALFDQVLSLRRTRFSPEVEAILQEKRPHLFRQRRNAVGSSPQTNGQAPPGEEYVQASTADADNDQSEG